MSIGDMMGIFGFIKGSSIRFRIVAFACSFAMLFGLSVIALLAEVNRQNSYETQRAQGNLARIEVPASQSDSAAGTATRNAEPSSYRECLEQIPASLYLLLLSLIFVTGGVAYWVALSITRPLVEVGNTISKFSEGDIDQRLAVSGCKEAAYISQSVTKMVDHMRGNVEQAYRLAYTDKTTNLPNREFFLQELSRSIKRCTRSKSLGALLFVDLDGFKKINDTYGHDIGDMLLKEFSKRVEQKTRSEDLIAPSSEKISNIIQNTGVPQPSPKEKNMVARLGGDEFTILLSDIRGATDAAIVSKRIIQTVSQPYVIDGNTIEIGASIGIAIIPQDGLNCESILKSADLAMYQAKKAGKNTYRFYSESLNREAQRRAEIECQLKRALNSKGQLKLFYQPQIDLASGKATSVEALLRWEHPTLGFIKPAEFINVAEDCGLIRPLGALVLRQACEQIVRFEKMGIDLCVSVNVSQIQLSGSDFSRIVSDIITETGANATKLVLEISEAAIMQNSGISMVHLTALDRIGVRCVIDDFGTSQSDITQLTKLPVDCLKIDNSFVRELSAQDVQAERIVHTILAMAQSLGFETIAEGVETQSQSNFLKKVGCKAAQGYLFARPMPEQSLLDWLKTGTPVEATV